MYYGNIFQNIPLFMEQMANPTIFQTVLSLSAPTDPVPCGGTLGSFSYTQANVAAVQACLPPPSTQPRQVAALAASSIPATGIRFPRNSTSDIPGDPNNNTVFEAEYTHVLDLHENKTINIDQKVVTGQRYDRDSLHNSRHPPTGCNMNYGNDNLSRPLSGCIRC